MSSLTTIHELLQVGGNDAIAVSGLERSALTYGRLRKHVSETVAALNDLGIGRNDRVAIVLNNGPEMATAFVSIACCATTAPLNPAYKQDEFDFYLADLGAKALVVEQGSDSPAVAAARAGNIRILDLCIDLAGPVGTFSLKPRDAAAEYQSVSDGLAGPDDVALVLHTSGTTSRPKIVPLSHANVCASAGNIQTTLSLPQRDASFSHSWSDGGRACDARKRGERFCSTGFRRAEVFLPARSGESNLVYGGSHDASGDPDPRQTQPGGHRPGAPAIHSIIRPSACLSWRRTQ